MGDKKEENLGLPWVFDPDKDNLASRSEFSRECVLGGIYTADHLHIARVWRACGPDDESTKARYTYLVDAANGYRELRASLELCVAALGALPNVPEFKQERALYSQVAKVLRDHPQY